MDADLLQALAEPSRLRIVALLDERPHSVGEVVAALGLRQPQVTKHLQTLARAGLVTVHPLGQRRVCALERSRFAELRDWLDGLARYEPSGVVLEEYRRAVDAETAAAHEDPAWAAGRRLRIERSFPVAPAALWPYWTEAGLIRTWWAPEHFSVADCEIDPRPGGVIRIVMQEGDGTQHAAAGHVRVVSPPNALRFEMAPLGPDGERLFDAGHTVRLVERCAGTELSIDIDVTSSTTPGAPGIAGMKLGWQQALNKLEHALVPPKTGVVMQMPTPHPMLETLEPMIGRWELRGRTDDAEADNIFGTVELEWLPGGHFLRQHSRIDVAGMVQVDGLELIGYEPETDSLASKVYTNLAPVPLGYHWKLEDRKLTIHMDAGATMHAMISEDGDSFAGRWQPDPGHENDPGMIAYDFAGSRLE